MKGITTIILSAAMSASLFSQNPTQEYALYQGDSVLNDWGMWRMADLDGDGLYLDLTEIMELGIDGNQINYIQDVKYRQEGSRNFVYIVATNDMVLRLEDIDGDGLTTGPGEIVEWADTRAGGGFSNTSPDGLDYDPVTGGFYVTDDNWSSGTQPGAGIHYYEDVNNDGDANDSGEFKQFVDAIAGTTIAGTSGQVSVDLGDFEAIMVDSTNGVVIGFAQQDCMLYAFQDLNGDGDAMDAGEAWNFCNLVDDVPGLEVNADVLAGTLPNAGCPSNSGVGMYATLEVLEFDAGGGPNGEDVYWIQSTASSASCNGAGGRLYRGIDNNGDLDLNDPGEVVEFYYGPNSQAATPSFYAGAAHDGGYSYRSGGGDLYFLYDANNDGDAMDAGEEIWVSTDSLSHFVGEMDNMPVGAFAIPGQNTPNWSTFGTGGFTSAGTVPEISLSNDLAIGQTTQVELTGAMPNTALKLFLGFSNTVWNRPPTFNLPFDLTGLGAPGNTLYVAGDYQFNFSTNAQGQASFPLTAPNNSNYQGLKVYMQWYTRDNAANPFGAVMSNAVEATVQ